MSRGFEAPRRSTSSTGASRESPSLGDVGATAPAPLWLTLLAVTSCSAAQGLSSPGAGRPSKVCRMALLSAAAAPGAGALPEAEEDSRAEVRGPACGASGRRPPALTSLGLRGLMVLGHLPLPELPAPTRSTSPLPPTGLLLSATRSAGCVAGGVPSRHGRALALGGVAEPARLRAKAQAASTAAKVSEASLVQPPAPPPPPPPPPPG
mmetsp:Transcript_52268/g.169818  ORF Transcript_52268/g.169818 Transcript_52268/m.169818 type:complete len:208 (+) Transcript_52268:312-935(+)